MCGLAQPRKVKFQLHQPLHPAQIQSAVLLPPETTDFLGDAELTDRIGNRSPLRNKDFNLPQLHYDLFGLVSLSNHSLVLLKMGQYYPSG